MFLTSNDILESVPAILQSRQLVVALITITQQSFLTCTTWKWFLSIEDSIIASRVLQKH